MEYVYFFLFIGIIVFAAFVHTWYKNGIVLRKLSKALDIKLSGTKGSAVWQGIKFEYEYDSGGGEDFTPPSFNITIMRCKWKFLYYR
jgi:hypothetical protein